VTKPRQPIEPHFSYTSLISEDGKRVESNTTMKNNLHRESSQLDRKCSILLDMPSPSVGIVVTTSYLYDVNGERIALGANGAMTM
jgi:hypothetical protein